MTSRDHAVAVAPPNADPSPSRAWSREAGRIDWLVIGAALVLAPWTLWIAAEPIPTFFALGLLLVFWPMLGVIWAISVFRSTVNDTSRFLALLLAVGSGLTLGGALPFFAVFMAGLVPLLAGLATALAGFALLLALEPRRRLIWLAAPTIVLSTIAGAASGVPAVARFAAAEPALTTYAEQLLRGDLAADLDEWADPIVVGSYEIVYTRVEGGCVHLGTAWTGILGDVPAGLAYCPGRSPVGGRGDGYQPFSGNWYRWSGLGFVID